MALTHQILLILHIGSGLLWLCAVNLTVFLIYPVWHRYSEYLYFENFRTEYIARLLKILSYSLVVALISGAGLIGVTGRDVFSGIYGILFSAKMVLLILTFVLFFPYMKISESDTADGYRRPDLPETVFHMRSVALLLSSIAVIAISIFARYE